MVEQMFYAGWLPGRQAVIRNVVGVIRNVVRLLGKETAEWRDGLGGSGRESF